jgi:hypothetical protein
MPTISMAGSWLRLYAANEGTLTFSQRSRCTYDRETITKPAGALFPEVQSQ